MKPGAVGLSILDEARVDQVEAFAILNDSLIPLSVVNLGGEVFVMRVRDALDCWTLQIILPSNTG